MIIFKQRFARLLLFCTMTGFSLFSMAQTVEIKGKVKKDNKPAGEVTIEISGPGINTQTLTSKENGGFSFILDLQKSYTIKFSKSGVVSKMIEFNTKLPPDQADIIYLYPFNLDLFDDLGVVSNTDAIPKPVARIAFDPTYENFMDDQNYTRKIKSEQELVRKAAEEIQRQREKVRLDSLNKIWNDSLIKAKSRETQSMSDKAEQDRLRIEKEKARQDSVEKANTAAQAAAKEKSRLDAEAKLKEKQRLEAELAAGIALIARQKAIEDSTQKAQAESKAIADAKALAEKVRLDTESKLKEKQKLEAELAAGLALKARQKAIDDSTQKALADAKALEDKKAKEEKDRLVAESKLKEKQKLEAELAAGLTLKARQKAIDDSTQKALAESKAITDAKALAEKVRLDAEIKLKEKQKLDAELASTLVAKERQKAISDSTQKALADAKLKNSLEDQARLKKRQDSLSIVKENELKKSKEAEENRKQALITEKARQDSLMNANESKRQKEEAERQQKLAYEKNKQDSLVNAQRLQKEKAEQERNARALAEIETKKQILAKSNATEGKAAPIPKTAPIPKIIDSDYRDGITEETLTEATRVIYRTVVKKEGSTFNYQKIVYGWGGIFYFKNENSITEISFNQEISNAKGK